MSIIWYLMVNNHKFSWDASAGFGALGIIEMVMEFAFLFKVCGFI